MATTSKTGTKPKPLSISKKQNIINMVDGLLNVPSIMQKAKCGPTMQSCAFKPRRTRGYFILLVTADHYPCVMSHGVSGKLAIFCKAFLTSQRTQLKARGTYRCTLQVLLKEVPNKEH
jgi:hypothetical protein